MKKENGFTLVEIIVALFIGSLVLTAIYSFLNMSQRSSSGIERRVAAQQDARGALELMAMEIQMASYNPGAMGGIWITTACAGLSVNQNYRGIQEATANAITIEMDVNDDGGIGDPNEIIRYEYLPANKYITRATNCTPAAFLGALNANSNQKTVFVENNEAAIPVFRYYNGYGDELAAPVTTQIPDIRRVEITLVVDTSVSDSSSYAVGNRRRIIYSTSVLPRNHFAINYN